MWSVFENNSKYLMAKVQVELITKEASTSPMVE